jgi:hypothetical protein
LPLDARGYPSQRPHVCHGSFIRIMTGGNVFKRKIMKLFIWMVVTCVLYVIGCVITYIICKKEHNRFIKSNPSRFEVADSEAAVSCIPMLSWLGLMIIILDRIRDLARKHIDKKLKL